MRAMKILHAALFVAAAATLASPALAKGPDTLAVREGLTVEQLDAEGQICMREAKNAERRRPHGTTPGGIAAAAAAATVTGWTDIERFVKVHNACLEGFGYRLVRLTPEERREFGRAKGKAARLAYIVEFSRRALAEGR
jgi:hypothetical protein